MLRIAMIMLSYRWPHPNVQNRRPVCPDLAESNPGLLEYVVHFFPARWYTKQYNKPFRHFFKKGYRQGLHIKVKAVPQSPLGHYCNQGWKEQRPLWFLTKVGAFYGVLDVEAFVEVTRNYRSRPHIIERVEFVLVYPKQPSVPLQPYILKLESGMMR